jgi:putative ABC transport system substrate-binding protein
MSMKRRQFITLLGGAAAAWPLAARAQQPGIRRIAALIGGGPESDPVPQSYAAAFRNGLMKLGWVEGRNLRIDLRFADSDLARIHAAAVELVRLSPEVIFASTGGATREVQQQTQTIPIVFAGPSELARGVQNIAQPEGNLTGFPILYPSIAGKWLELLKEVAPRVGRVAVIANKDGASGPTYTPSVDKAASVMSVKVMAVGFGSDDELEHALDAFAAEPGGSLIVLPGSATSTHDNRSLVRRLTVRHRLPTIHFDRLYPAEGGLMSYGSDIIDLHRRAASYVDRLLLGAKVSHLPVQLPTKFDLVVNLKAAKAIGLTIPESFLLRADEVIE